MKIAGIPFVLIFALLLSSANYAQTGQTDLLDIDTNCEVNIVGIEGVMRKSAEDDRPIFIISHRAKTERKRVDWARLRYTRMAIAQFRRFPSDRVIIAVGEPTEKKHGNLEFWVSGKLQLISYIKKNQRKCFHM
jgi:hypothetical protein